MNCPDCKDGFYYPLVGSPEPCQTCAAPDELHGIYVPRDTGLFYHQQKPLGEILNINVLDYYPLATRFDGNSVIEYTDTESKEFQEITGNREPRTWWGVQYLVEHVTIGCAKFNYKPIDSVYHFHGPCEVTLRERSFSTQKPPRHFTWFQKIMRQL